MALAFLKRPETDDLRLGNVLAAYRKALALVVALSCVINLLMLLTPLYMLHLFRGLDIDGSVDDLTRMAVIAAMALLFFAILEAIRSVLLMKGAHWLDSRISERVLSAGASPGNRSSKDALVQGFEDLSALRGFLVGSAMPAVLDAPWALLFIVAVFVIHPLLGALVLLAAFAILMFARWTEARTQIMHEMSQTASANARRQARATVRNVDVVGAMGMTQNVMRRWQDARSETFALEATVKRQSTMFNAISKVVRYTLQVGVIAVGAWLVMSGKLSIGAAVAALFLMHRALTITDAFADAWKPLRKAREAYARITDLLNRQSEQFTRTTLPIMRRGLVVNRCSFHHAGSNRPVVNNIGFELHPGDIMTLAGTMGAGKTTLCRLMVGALKPSRGTIVFEGFRLEHWKSEVLGRHIGYLPERVQLFQGTVHDNIARMGEAKREDVVAAAQLARAHDMIESLPAGYDTDVGDDGLNLSAGQRQQVGLARAVFGEPALVVLDEPDSNLDKHAREDLLQMIIALRGHGIMAVIISHRESVLRLGNKIGVLRDGELTLWSMAPGADTAAEEQSPSEPDATEATGPFRIIT